MQITNFSIGIIIISIPYIERLQLNYYQLLSTDKENARIYKSKSVWNVLHKEWQ